MRQKDCNYLGRLLKLNKHKTKLGTHIDPPFSGSLSSYMTCDESFNINSFISTLFSDSCLQFIQKNSDFIAFDREVRGYIFSRGSLYVCIIQNVQHGFGYNLTQG